ncbi:hypothetical protein Q6346_00155 [Isoptericola sp. b490]|uniref:hypothetical protein n=1 Tax=Actinotalea lenta TaxID=3064654 RepID=UPI0027124340|nr:hypothetical protein [Isoptericola sp. b490]MDO8119719.1 hypothetical protein [Isoptericola sp. b490]
MTPKDPAADYARAVEKLASLANAVARQELHAEVADAVAALRLAVVRVYGSVAVPRPGGAQRAILEHLESCVGEWVPGGELAAVAGIGEWARRVRELRVEQGYEIDEERGHYRLRHLEPDLARRARWETVTAIRASGGEPIDRVRMLLEQLVGHVMTAEELGRAARSRDAARLARLLRAEEQMPIEMSGDADDLAAGEIRLTSTREAYLLPPSQTLFSEELRARVFGRDRHTCSVCRRDRRTASPSPDHPFYLLVRHVTASADDLASLPVEQLANLALLETRCNTCLSR